MAGLCFFFEQYDVDVWSGRRIDLDAYNYAAKVAGDIDKMIVVNRTSENIQTPDADIEFSVVSKLADAPITGSTVHVCCPWDTAGTLTSLWDFGHDVDWYVIGPAAGWTNHIVGDGIYIPGAHAVAMHGVHAAAVIMAHRYHVVGEP